MSRETTETEEALLSVPLEPTGRSRKKTRVLQITLPEETAIKFEMLRISGGISRSRLLTRLVEQATKGMRLASIPESVRASLLNS